MADTLSQAQERAAIAEARLKAIQLEQTYRAIDASYNSRKRSAPTIEMGGEDDQLGGLGRLQSIAKARDVRRNYGGAKGIETQIWLNAVGTGPKVIMHFDDEAKQDEWSNWFNSTFAKRCDGRGDHHLADLARMALTAVVRDGDILVYFNEKAIPNADGTLWFWEADQLPEISPAEFKRRKKDIIKQLGLPSKTELEQKDGIILDEYGRSVGYFAMKNRLKHGKTLAKFKEVTVLKKENCRLLFNPWRVNQKRGISDMIECANIWQDLERFNEALIQRSIVQSYLALKVKKKDSIAEARTRIYDTEASAIPNVDSSEKTKGTHYKNFEKLSQNAIEYIDEDEDIESMQLAGDLPDAQQLIDFMQGNAGWSQGLSRMYSTGKADSSYSASMAENNMTWPFFEYWQKFIERYLLDWVAEKAFRWALKTGRLTAAKDSEWVDNYSWHNWPKCRAINPSQEANARKIDLGIGAITYEDLHGPNWRKKVEQLGEQIQASRDAGFWTELFKPLTGNSNGNTTNE